MLFDMLTGWREKSDVHNTGKALVKVCTHLFKEKTLSNLGSLQTAVIDEWYLFKNRANTIFNGKILKALKLGLRQGGQV